VGPQLGGKNNVLGVGGGGGMVLRMREIQWSERDLEE